MPSRNRSLFAVVPLLVFCVFFAQYQIQKQKNQEAANRNAFEIRPERVMGTTCQLAVITETPEQEATAMQDLEEARQLLARLESVFSKYIEASEVSHINQAPAGEWLSVSDEVMEVLEASQLIYNETDGTLDITCSLLLDLWKKSGRMDQIPETSAVENARKQSNWAMLHLGEKKLLKDESTVHIDLGALAKGYCIQKACDFLSDKGYPGVLVDIGGDLKVLGSPQKGELWDVEVKDPDSEGMMETLHLSNVSVCTSGDYERYYTIGGTRFSHIMDPRTGWPADKSKSVTVIGADTMYTDAWATALSVLGEEGLDLLPEGYEAMILYREKGELKSAHSSGFYKTDK